MVRRFGPPASRAITTRPSVAGLIDEIRKAPGMDAYVVACFDDTGLDAAAA